jgi:hypothetical protein
MQPEDNKERLGFENYWRRDVSDIRDQVLSIWKDHGGPTGNDATARLNQIVWVVKNSGGSVVGLSTAYKVYIKQLRNHLFATRLLLVPQYRIPGLTSKLFVETRDFLESIHSGDEQEQAIGVITLVENPRMKEYRNEAVWPASGMVYIGNSQEGHHIRVYYFKDARIAP